jgi:hypothetical protein
MTPLAKFMPTIDTDQFSLCFSRWVADLANISGEEVIVLLMASA